MEIYLKRLTIATISLLSLSLPAFGGQLDDDYLTAFGLANPLQTSSALEKSVLLPAENAGNPTCGTPLKHKLRLDWVNLEPTTQKTLAKTVASLSTWVGTVDEKQFKLSGGHFLIHYTTTGTDAPPLTDNNVNGVPDWVETVAQTFENVATTYSGLGWRLAPTVNNATYDVYLRNLVDVVFNGQPTTLYGQTTVTQLLPASGFANAAASYIEIDKDFTNAKFTGAAGGPYLPAESLQITAAHEYHHAIQYGYNVFFDVWYAEATSTWFEDELYDSVNQLYNYISNWFGTSLLSLNTPTSTATGGGYGRWIFNRFLAEQHDTGTIKTVKSAWEKLATLNSPGNNTDIPMIPVLESLLLTAPFNSSLGADFFGFAKRVYVRDWGTASVSHPQDIGLIHPYVPVASVSIYPASALSTLGHYAFAYYKFTPASTVPNLNIIINKTSGIRTAVFKKSGAIISEIAAASDGSYTVNGFGLLNPATNEVVLLAANTTNIDSHQAAFTTSGTPAAVIEPATAAPAPVSGGGGGGGGCFIATAAYGSYLHPQVQILRDFRDTWLVTNAPGRAFVALYYRLSPPVADFIAQHETLRLLVRLLLTPVIFVICNLMTAVLVTVSVILGLQLRRVRLAKVRNAMSE